MRRLFHLTTKIWLELTTSEISYVSYVVKIPSKTFFEISRACNSAYQGVRDDKMWIVRGDFEVSESKFLKECLSGPDLKNMPNA